MTNMGEASQTAPKKKGPLSGCLVWLGIGVVLIIGLVVSSNMNANREKEAAAVASSEAAVAAEEFKRVDSATATKVKDACVQQVKTVAANAAREIAGVKPKFYSITATSFQGDVEQVSLLRNKSAYEVEFTYTATHRDGTVNTTTRTCRVTPDFDFVELRP